MSYKKVLIGLVVGLAIYSIACEGENYPTGPDHVSPPGWEEGKVGIKEVIPGDRSVMVYWHDAFQPPVQGMDVYVERYLIFAYDSPYVFEEIPQTWNTTQPFVITELTNGVEYWFGVRAENSEGRIETNTVTLSTIPSSNPDDKEPPVWPGEPGVGNVVAIDNSLEVSWDEATDVSTPPVEYLVYVDQDDQPWDQDPLIITAPENTITVADRANGEWWVSVRARDSVNPANMEMNTLTKSAIIDFSGADTTPPVWDDTIGIVSAVANGSNIDLTWGSATDAQTPPVEYLIYLDTDNEPWDQTPVLIQGGDQSHQLTGIAPGDYWVGVRAQDSMNPPNIDTNLITLPVTIEVDDIEPPVWQGNVGVKTAYAIDNTIYCDWDPAIDLLHPPTTYLVYIDSDASPWDQTPAEVPDPALNFTSGTLPDGPYWVGVLARDKDTPPNVDDNTKTIMVTLGAAADSDPPVWQSTTGVTSVVKNGTSGTVYWGVAIDELTPPVIYLVYHDVDDQPWDVVPVEVPAPDLEYTFNNLPLGYHFFGVRVRDSANPANADSNTIIYGISVD